MFGKVLNTSLVNVRKVSGKSRKQCNWRSLYSPMWRKSTQGANLYFSLLTWIDMFPEQLNIPIVIFFKAF